MRFKKSIFIIIVILFGKLSFAQNSDSLETSKTDTPSFFGSPAINPKQSQIILKFDYDYGSTLNNAFLQKFILGGTVDNQLIDNNYERLNKNRNSIGNTADFTLQYYHLMNSFLGLKNIGYSAAMEWHQNNEFNFTSDAFSMLMYGNKDFAGKKADLSQTEYQQLKYSQIKAGLFKENPKNNSKFGFQLALNIGNQFTAFESPNSSIYTDTLGREIILEGDYKYLHSDYLGENIGKVQGYGASLDLFYEINKLKKYKFKFELNNIGFIRWNKNTKYSSDTKQIIFKGIEIDNLFAIPDSILSTTFNDSITNHLEYSKIGNYNTIIPLTISLYYQYHLNSKFSVSGKFRHVFFSLYSPYYQLGGEYNIRGKYYFGLNANYGAYTKFNIGASFRMIINTNFAFELQSRYLSGFMGQQFSGMGGFLQINYKF